MLHYCSSEPTERLPHVQPSRMKKHWRHTDALATAHNRAAVAMEDACTKTHNDNVVVGFGGSQVGGQPRDLAINVRRVQLHSSHNGT